MFKRRSFSLVGMGLLLISTLLSVFIPYIVKNLIDNTELYFFGFNNYLLLAAAYLGQVIFSSLGYFMFAKITMTNVYDLRQKIMHNLLVGRYSFFDHNKIEQVPSHLTTNIKTYEHYVQVIPQFISGLFLIVISIIFLFSLDWKLSAVMFISLPLLGIIVTPLSAFSGKLSNYLQKSSALYTEKIINCLQNILYIKTLNAESQIEENIDQENKELKNIAIKSGGVDAIANPLVFLLFLIIVSLIFVYGGKRVQSGEITIGVLISFLLYLLQLINPIANTSNFFMAKSKWKTNKAELEKYLTLESETTNEGKEELTEIKSLSFCNLSFAYERTAVLDNLSCEIPIGSKIAVVGPSGSGKSTLYKLLLRLYEPDSGKILLNAQELNSFSKKSIRRHIALVPQENSIIGSSLSDFLNLGQEHKISDAQLIDTLNTVGLAAELNLNTENIAGYDFGLAAKNLSVGQKQRLMIAKALLKEASIYLLDESTASVDSELETLIFETLLKFKPDKTIISIAHRLSTVKYADTIIFLEEGKISGIGTHNELYAQHEHYRHFIDLQLIKTETEQAG